MSVVPADVEALVRHEDVDLVTLSEEQCAVLWADDGLAASELRQPILLAALRSLVAAGLAGVGDDGGLHLQGPAVLVRASRVERRRTLALVTGADPDAPILWTVLSPTLLLEQSVVMPGVYRFTLRAVRRAATELVRELLAEGAASTAEAVPWSGDASAEASLAEIRLRFPVESRMMVLDSGAITSGEPNTSTVLDDVTVWGALSPDDEPGWSVRRKPGATALVSPIDRRMLREWLLEAMRAREEH